MRDEALIRRPEEPLFAQPLPACLDALEVFAGGQVERQLSFHRLECLGGFPFLGGTPVPHRLVAAEQCGRESAVKLDDLHGSGNRLNQHEALQFPLRGPDNPVKTDKQTIYHHANRDR